MRSAFLVPILVASCVVSFASFSRPAAADVDLDTLDPEHQVPADLLALAVDYLNANSDSFPNQNFISVVDFRPSSAQYRLFIVDLGDGSVARYHTAHGAGSVKTNPAFATVFGNVNNSNMSSLGFARTAEVYVGSQKRSLRLDGLSASDSNLRDRGIIVHGADQVHEANVVQGLGAGCIMLDWKVRDEVIDKIRDGSLVLMGYSKLRSR